MPQCLHCQKLFTALDPSGVCERCEAIREERRRVESTIICSHCAELFDPRGYARHAVRISNRRGVFPKGRSASRP